MLDATIILTLPMSRSPSGREAICTIPVSGELVDDGGLELALEAAIEFWRSDCRKQHGADLLPTDGIWQIAGLAETIDITGHRTLKGQAVHT
jgi:hypothetical protein